MYPTTHVHCYFEARYTNPLLVSVPTALRPRLLSHHLTNPHRPRLIHSPSNLLVRRENLTPIYSYQPRRK